VAPHDGPQPAVLELLLAPQVGEGLPALPEHVLRRAGGCTPDPAAPEINAWLRASGN